MVTSEIMFRVREDETIDVLGLQDFHVLFQMLRPEVTDNGFAINCVVDIFYYFYLEDVPSINPNVAAIFVARKKYLDWVMQTKEFEHFKGNTVNKKDKSLIIAVLIVNAIIDTYLVVIKQYSNEDIQLINRFTRYKNTIFTAQFLQKIDYHQKFLMLELDICTKVVEKLEEGRDIVTKEIEYFFSALLHAEKELFDNIDVPFANNLTK